MYFHRSILQEYAPKIEDKHEKHRIRLVGYYQELVLLLEANQLMRLIVDFNV